MKQWSADVINDPNNEYQLIIEILYEEKDVAIVKQGKNGLELTWYPHEKELTIPCDWLIKIINNLEQAHLASKKIEP